MTSGAGQGALAGIRIADFSHFVAGPMVSMILGDYGADVVKIEPPGTGDDFRRNRFTSKDVHGAPFLWVNRNKRSIELDLTNVEGRSIARRLIDRSDVLLENFRTGVAERLGLGYDEVSAHHPGLVYCSVSAAGREGSLAHRSGFDPIAQAESGFMQLLGNTEGAAAVAGPPIIDMTTAMMAANTVLAALVARGRDGLGQRVEVSLFDQGVAMLGHHAMTYLMTGENTRAPGKPVPKAPGVGTYETSDGPIVLCCINERTWRQLVVDVLDAPELTEPPFDTLLSRGRHRDALNERLARLLSTRPSEQWLSAMGDAGVPSARLASLEEALAHPTVEERGLVGSVEHSSLGKIPNIASPSRFSRTPVVEPSAAPELGQHTREVLREVLDLDDAEFERLARAGAFGGG